MTHISLFSSKEDGTSVALVALLEEISLKEINQLLLPWVNSTSIGWSLSLPLK